MTVDDPVRGGLRRAAVLPGPGVVVRSGALVAVLNSRASDTFLESLLALSRDGDGGPSLDVVAALAAAEVTPVDVAVAVPDAGGVAVYLHGEVSVAFEGGGLSGSAGRAVREVVPWSAGGVVLRLGRVDTVATPIPDRFQLVDGVVPGGGVALFGGVPSGRHRREPAVTPPARSARLDRASADPPRAPLPVAGDSEPESSQMILGIHCSRGHFNDPRVSFCSVCGIRTDQRTGVLVSGARPSLGWLLLDNGVTVLLDSDIVLGRDPASAGALPEGVQAVAIEDESGTVSRRHAELRLVGWDVELRDLGSVNGTFVARRGRDDEIRVGPQPHTLSPGTRVRLGSYTFVFDSPHGRIAP